MPKENNLKTPDDWDEILNGTAPKAPTSKGQIISPAELIRATGYNPGTLQNLKSLGVITQLPNGKYCAVETLGAIVRKLRDTQDRNGNDDKKRKTKAEADHAEIKALTAAGETCLLIHAQQFWTDSRTKIRQTIEQAEYLTKAHREKLLSEIANLEFDELGPSE